MKKLTERNYFIISKNYEVSLIYIDYVNRKKDKIKFTYLNYYGKYWKNYTSQSLTEFIADMQYCKKILLKKEKDNTILDAIKDKKIRDRWEFPKKGTKRWYQLFGKEK